MNPKTVLVALTSALFAAGLTYWVVTPVRQGGAVMAKATTPPPASPPLVISTAGPELSTPPTGKSLMAWSKPSPTGEPVETPPPAPQPAKVDEEPAAKPPIEASPAPRPEPVAAPPPTVATPQPPTRVTLSPPKEIDRPAEQAILRDQPMRAPNTVTINEGTVVAVRLGETLTVQKNLTGDTFFATLDQALVADGFVIAEKGARVEGKIVEVDKAGRMSGTSRMSLELTQVNTSDGQRVHLQTSTFTKDGADRNRKNDAAMIGGGAVLGAAIGGASSGGKGAGIGAGVGAAAGTGAVLLSGGRNVTIPVETKLSFRVQKPITITERVMQ